MQYPSWFRSLSRRTKSRKAKATEDLVAAIEVASKDGNLTSKERSVIMTAMWRAIREYRSET